MGRRELRISERAERGGGQAVNLRTRSTRDATFVQETTGREAFATYTQSFVTGLQSIRKAAMTHHEQALSVQAGSVCHPAQ